MNSKLTKLITAIAMMLAISLPSFAHDFEVDGIYYNIKSESDKTVYVTYRGSDYSSYYNEYSGRVTIPETVTYSGKTYSVTSIGESAFAFCSGLTSVTIPNSVTSIGSSAFYECSGLTSVTIPNSVTSIGDVAFYYCSGLKSVTIPNSVTSIGKSAFYNCSGLTSVTIGNSVTSIGNYAFNNCSGLTSVTIPNSVTEIGNSAFSGCSGLVSVTIPNSVTEIGNSVFSGCSGLTSINVESGNSKYDSRDNCNAIIETETNTLIAGCQNTVIPNSVTSIGDDAFEGCSGLVSVTIPNTVTEIGEAAFYECSGLTEVTIPNSVTSIGRWAFYACSSLTSITIPNTITSIGDYAFRGCSGLTSVTIGNSVTSIGEEAFHHCTRLYQVINLSKLSLTKGSTNHGYVAYYASIVINAPSGIINGDFFWSISEVDDVNILARYLGAASELILPDDYNGENYVIGDYAFSGCSSLTSVTIPNTVTSIGESAFRSCSGLTSVTIPNSVTSIGDSAFRSCSGLTEVTIPNSVTSIGEAAFYECSGLTEVTIGNSVTEIGDYAFRGCSGLTEVNYNAENCTSMGSYDYTVFKDCTNLKTVNIGNLVKSIPHYAFRGCYGLKSVTISNSVTSIGKSAFEDCSDLTEVTIPNSVTSIDQYAFEGCSGLTEVTIGNSVSSIKDVFGGCKKITNLVIADGTETLSLGNSFTDCPFVKLYLGRDYSYNTTNSPFSNKKTLKEITIGNSITSIREKEFLNCIGLTSLTIGTGVLSIGTNAFSYYDNNNYSNLDIKKVIWLTNTPPQGYETVAGEVNYVANNRYSDLSNVTIYPYLSSLFEVDGIKYVPVSPSERTCDALDCSYETTISDTNIGKTVSFKGIEMNIKAVKPYTFYDNTNITKATIDSEFNGSIGDYAFAYCNKIDEIILPDGVTSLGGSAFEGCSSLASVEIGSGIPALNDNAFYGCTPLSEITIPANVTSIGNNVFGKCSSLEELTITDRDTELSLGSNGSNPLFSDCPLKSVYIGGNISYPTSSDYGYSPFYRNTSLETVVITDKETEISENEFYGCTALKTVYMGDGVKTIGDWAFSGCSSLDSFSFGTGMKTIGTEAFSDCTAMTKLYSKAVVPPTCGSQALDDINKWNCELYVPQASITKYQIADQWKEFFFIKDIESGIEDVYVEESVVTVEDGKIVVKNVTGIVTIYNLNGIAVASETADGNEVRFDNLQPGVYIVVVNNKSVKVVL